jgi:hypothetical protein
VTCLTVSISIVQEISVVVIGSSFDRSKPVTELDVKECVDGLSKSPGSLISMTRSLVRLRNIMSDQSEDNSHSVAIVNLPLLKKLGIGYADVKSDLKCKSRYACRHYFVVHGWIPSRCSLGVLTASQFKELYHSSNMPTALSKELFEQSRRRPQLLSKGMLTRTSGGRTNLIVDSSLSYFLTLFSQVAVSQNGIGHCLNNMATLQRVCFVDSAPETS